MSVIEVQVPDLGDVGEVGVIEVLVKPGDAVRLEQSLITVESDKASMEIPSPAAGTVRELRVMVGDRVRRGSQIMSLEVSADVPAGAATADSSSVSPSVGSAAVPDLPSAATVAARPMQPPPAAAPAAPAPRPSPPDGTDCDVLVLGGGPGGYSAAFRAADLGLSVILVERYAELGGVCLNVGCIPSKALLHVAGVMQEAAHLGEAGIVFGAPRIDLEGLRAHRDKVVGKLVRGVGGMAKSRKVRVLRGYGSFADAHRLMVEETTGSGQDKTGASQTVSFKYCIIAAGSQAVHLPFLPRDARVIDSTGALQLPSTPKRMLVVGGGIIGLEMGTVYSALGARLDVVEMQSGLMPGADRDLVRVWQKMNLHRFDHVLLGCRTTAAEAVEHGIRVSFAGEGAPAEPQLYDLVLQAVGRGPNGKKIGADRAGLTPTQAGFITVDPQQRTAVPHLFAIGDIVGPPMLAHKATHEGHVAAEVIAGELLGDAHLKAAALDTRIIPSVAYTDPEVAWVGLTEEQAKAQGIEIRKGHFPWTASGRAIANGRDEGFTKLLFDGASGRIVGGGIVGTHAGELISEIALAIEMGADAIDMGHTIHPHPTLGETVGLAAEAAEGSCTDILPPKRR